MNILAALIAVLAGLFGKKPAAPEPAPTYVPPESPHPAFASQHASPRCKAFIKGFETCKLKAYPDPKTNGPPWTCGWGTTGPDIGPQTEWTQDTADLRFEQDIAHAEALVRFYVAHPMTQGQFDAFCSIFQNVGPGSAYHDGIGRLKGGQPSTLLRKFNAGDIEGCEAEWCKWVSPGSSVEHGLRLRREGELEMFREGDPS